jgi:hypothetical protein
MASEEASQQGCCCRSQQREECPEWSCQAGRRGRLTRLWRWASGASGAMRLCRCSCRKHTARLTAARRKAVPPLLLPADCLCFSPASPGSLSSSVLVTLPTSSTTMPSLYNAICPNVLPSDSLHTTPHHQITLPSLVANQSYSFSSAAKPLAKALLRALSAIRALPGAQ